MKKIISVLVFVGLQLALMPAQAQIEALSPVRQANAAGSTDAGALGPAAGAAAQMVSASAADVLDETSINGQTVNEPEASVQFADDYPNMTKASSAIAERFYVSPMFDYSFADKDRRANDGLGGRLIVGKQISDGFNIEISGLYTAYKGHEGGQEKLTGGGIAALVFPSMTLSGMFGSAGLSVANGKSDVSTDPDTSKRSTLWNIGLGYLIGPIGWLNDGSLRLEARYQADEKNVAGAGNDLLEPVLSAGLLIPLGAAPAPPAPPAPPVVVVPVLPPADSDGDGVPDNLDQCPDTPSGTQVNDVGCPLPPPCKPPEAGQKVDLSGCAVGDSIVLRGVNFEYDKSKLTLNAQTLLDGVTDALTRAPNIAVEVDGHTDSRGSDAYNQELSESRAQAVMQYLADHGIAAERLSAVGYGETQPIADNDTDEGRELNRRVELKIVGVGVGSPQAAAPAEPSAEAGQGVDDTPLSPEAMTPAAAEDAAGVVEATPDSSGPSSALEPAGVSGDDLSFEPQPGQ